MIDVCILTRFLLGKRKRKSESISMPVLFSVDTPFVVSTDGLIGLEAKELLK
jgi:hypothetical protein